METIRELVLLKISRGNGFSGPEQEFLPFICLLNQIQSGGERRAKVKQELPGAGRFMVCRWASEPQNLHTKLQDPGSTLSASSFASRPQHPLFSEDNSYSGKRSPISGNQRTLWRLPMYPHLQNTYTRCDQRLRWIILLRNKVISLHQFWIISFKVLSLASHALLEGFFLKVLQLLCRCPPDVGNGQKSHGAKTGE